MPRSDFATFTAAARAHIAPIQKAARTPGVTIALDDLRAELRTLADGPISRPDAERIAALVYLLADDA